MRRNNSVQIVNTAESQGSNPTPKENRRTGEKDQQKKRTDSFIAGQICVIAIWHFHSAG